MKNPTFIAYAVTEEIILPVKRVEKVPVSEKCRQARKCRRRI